MKNWKWNPKTKGSGIITCIPQKGKCPNNCSDCFFQSGRSYLEPLEDNLPHIPPKKLTKDRIVRINDGNDSNNQRKLVEQVAQQFDGYFFNTAIPENLKFFPAPVVLTVNLGKMTDTKFYKLNCTPLNLMFVRIRTNTWNLEKVVKPAIKFYSDCKVPIILTFMAYYTNAIPKRHKSKYIWKKRTLNSYWVLKQKEIEKIMNKFKTNPFVYSCGIKGQYACKFCGNCIREYYNTKERIRGD